MVLYARYLSGRRALLSAARVGLFVDSTSVTAPNSYSDLSSAALSSTQRALGGTLAVVADDYYPVAVRCNCRFPLHRQA